MPEPEERMALEAARASRGAWLLPGDTLDDAARALRYFAACDADVGPTVWAPYELLDHLGCAAVVDLQLRSAFARWVAALRISRQARVPGSFGQPDA